MIYVVGIVVVFVLVAIYSDRERRGCRWRLSRAESEPGASAWHCVACGARTITPEGERPRVCLKGKDSGRTDACS